MEFTSIRNEGHGNNTQKDYCAKNQHDALAKFEDDCLKNNTNWAHLFDDETGTIIASFTKKDMLITKTINLGSEVVITKQICGHTFEIGEIVKVIDVKRDDDICIDLYECQNQYGQTNFVDVSEMELVKV